MTSGLEEVELMHRTPIGPGWMAQTGFMKIGTDWNQMGWETSVCFSVSVLMEIGMTIPVNHC